MPLTLTGNTRGEGHCLRGGIKVTSWIVDPIFQNTLVISIGIAFIKVSREEGVIIRGAVTVFI